MGSEMCIRDRSTDSDGVFVIGSENVPGVNLIEFTTNGLQNGADAVALYAGVPPETPTTTNLLDAIVYSTGDPDDNGLLLGLGETIQFDESANGSPTTDSLQLSGSVFVAGAPTPGVFIVPEPSSFFMTMLGGLFFVFARRR